MNKRGMSESIVQVILIVVVIALVIGVVYSLIGGSKDNLKNLQSCASGVISTLGGKDARCSISKDCMDSKSDTGYYQYIGEGWGCPKETPYCCLLLDNNKNPVSASKIREEACKSMNPGTLAIIMNGGCNSNDGQVIDPKAKIGVRYYFSEKDKATGCTYSVKIKGREIVKDEPLPCKSSSTQYVDIFESLTPTIVELYSTPTVDGGTGYDPYELNDGVDLQVIFKNDKEHIINAVTSKITPPLCNRESVKECAGKPLYTSVTKPGYDLLECRWDGSKCVLEKMGAKNMQCNNEGPCNGINLNKMPCLTEIPGDNSYGKYKALCVVGTTGKEACNYFKIDRDTFDMPGVNFCNGAVFNGKS